tara:strand:+ start:294 stop:908 length:615 start_codon:yes stop_codon:yes gene_type:complete
MSNNIGHIFYINLDKRTDRKIEFEIEMKKLNWTAERFSGIYYPPPKGIVGCGKSHLAVLKLAKERNYKNVLIFEDDFECIETSKVFEEELNKLFTQKPDFDVCFLSYNLHESEEMKDLPFLKKVLFSATASAYIVNNHYYQKIIDLYEEALPKLEKTMQHWIYANDQIWKSLQQVDNWYCFARRLGKQRDGFSDNANQQVIYNC